MPNADVLIIGSGIAGMSLAIKLTKQFPEKQILVVTKDDEMDSNTRHAQGGISVVCDVVNDCFENHIKDTLRAGDGLCNKDIVEAVISHGPDALYELINNGVDFDRTASSDLSLGKEGGHSKARIAHCKDMTGFQIATSLLEKARTLPGIALMPHHAAIDLITSGTHSEKKRCIGAYVLNKKKSTVEVFLSNFTILATGGVGQVYKVTTNPSIATGDGIAMAHRAGAEIRNMEFVQFHPTALYAQQKNKPHFLITEALRGYGAFIRNKLGDRFLLKHDSAGELACRDVVARAIEDEIRTSQYPHVYLDCRHLPSKELVRNFPTVYDRCLATGIDITKDLIPIIPAAHYLCGGVTVDKNSETSIKNLYAVGECSFTGLHGANRLASNSLLEAVVFSEFCFKNIKHKIEANKIKSDVFKIENHYSVTNDSNEMIGLLREKVQDLTTRFAGITRTTKDLNYACTYLEKLSKGIDEFYSDRISAQLIELKNLITCSKLIIEQSLTRTINKGVFYNSDFDSRGVISNKQRIYH